MRIESSAPAPSRMGTRLRVDRITTGWMLLAFVVAVTVTVTTRSVPQPWWTVIHLIVLGVLTNAILQWSWYFTRSLLRLRPDNPHAGVQQTWRLVAFNVFLVVLVLGMWFGSLPTVLVGAGGVGVVIAWHGIALLLAMRTRWASRFAVIIRYYAVAAGFLVLGILAGAAVAADLLQPGSLPAPGHVLDRDGLTAAHSLLNTFGWVGLSIAGTLVTLGPTVLRTRMEPNAVKLAVAALPVVALALLGAAVAAALNQMVLVGIALALFTVGITWTVGVPLVTAVVRKPPRDYAAWTLLSGCVWVLVGLVAVTIRAFGTETVAQLRVLNPEIIAIIGVGGLLQVFVGALTYLMPIVVGGGPAAVKVGIATLNWAGPFRATFRNLALIMTLAMPAPLWWLLVAAMYGIDIVSFAAAGIRQGREK